MEKIDIIEKNKELYKGILFTVAYYNVLEYYPTSFFIWKNLISVHGNGEKCTLLEGLKVLNKLAKEGLLIEKNGVWGIKGIMVEYKQQIQKNKISTQKIKEVRKSVKLISWLPYLRELFLTGTLAMKRGGAGSDWDVLTVLKKDRIWLGRLILTGWLQLVGKRRYSEKIEDRFCLNQFIVSSSLKFEEKNEFISNEILLSKSLLEKYTLKDEIVRKNIDWLNSFKPNFKFREKVLYEQKNNLLQTVQKKLEWLLEMFGLAKLMNIISKKIMIQKIINNPKTYASQADIRYSDFFLVFLPHPQRGKIKKATLELLTEIK